VRGYHAARPSCRRVLHLDYASPMTGVFPRIRTVATGERSKALQGVVLVLSWERNILVKPRKPPTN
jgi:hypothetical protein